MFENILNTNYFSVQLTKKCTHAEVYHLLDYYFQGYHYLAGQCRGNAAVLCPKDM